MDPATVLVAIVDDEYPIRKALTRLLRSASFEVESYSSGPQFLDSLAVRQPDCAVLDIRMPGMTGFDIQDWLRSRGNALPIVFITALDDPGDTARALQRGAHALLRKPFGDQEFLDAITGAVAAGRADG